MPSPTNWPHPDDDPELYLRHQEKRIANEQRRPMVRKASDILGPGFAPFATQLIDWNADEAAFNGYFWSDTGALNTPVGVGVSVWMGITISSGTIGFQQVWEVSPGTMTEKKRVWALTSGVRVYGAWA